MPGWCWKHREGKEKKGWRGKSELAGSLKGEGTESFYFFFHLVSKQGRLNPSLSLLSFSFQIPLSKQTFSIRLHWNFVCWNVYPLHFVWIASVEGKGGQWNREKGKSELRFSFQVFPIIEGCELWFIKEGRKVDPFNSFPIPFPNESLTLPSLSFPPNLPIETYFM